MAARPLFGPAPGVGGVEIACGVDHCTSTGVAASALVVSATALRTAMVVTRRRYRIVNLRVQVPVSVAAST